MSAVTFEVAPAAINKKAMGLTLAHGEQTRSMVDRIKAAPAKARDGLMNMLKALKLDALAGGLKNAALAVWGKAHWLVNSFRRIVGFQMALVYSLADNRAFGYLGKAVNWLKDKLVAATVWTSNLVCKIPVVGPRLSQWHLKATAMTISVGQKVADYVVKARNAVKASKFGQLLTGFVAGTIERQVIDNFVKALPVAYRVPVRSALFFASLYRFATALFGNKKAKADTVVPFAPEPYTETMDVVLTATGLPMEIVVNVDSHGDKWVTYDGQTYAADDLPEEFLTPVTKLDVSALSPQTIDELAKNANAALGKVNSGGNRATRREAAKVHGPRG